MNTYMISYDLFRPGQNYQGLFEAIKRVSPTHWHILQSAWIVVTNRSAVEIRDMLLPYLDRNDKMIVNVVAPPAAWYGFDTTGSQWLHRNI